jgi:hypothetical protein
MSRRCDFTTVTVTCLVLLAGGFAQAAEDLLSVIPEQSLGFVLVNRLAESDAKIQALCRQMQLPAPSPLSMLKAQAGIKQALDEKGSAAIVVMPGEEAGSRPAAVLFLPVTDYPQFIRQLKPDDVSAKIVEVRVADQPFLVGNCGGYAVVARPSHRNALQQVLDSPKRVAAEVAPLQKWLARADLAGLLTRRGAQLLSARGQEALQQAKKGLAALPDDKKLGMEAAIAVFGVYEKMVKAAGEEINNYAFAARIDDGGNLHVIERVRLTPNGQAAKMLGQVKPSEGNLLAGLPQGPFVFALAGVLPESAGECLMQFSAEIMKAAPGLYGLNEQQVDKLIEISNQSMKQIRGMSMMMGVGKPGDPIYSDFAVVEKVDDSKAFLAEYRQTIAVMNELLKDAKNSILAPSELKEVEVGGTPALEFTMKIPTAPAAANVPNYDELMKKLFGPGGEIAVFLAAADDHTIVASYTGKKLLQESLEAVRGGTAGLGGDPEVAKTAAMLPSGAQWVGYISPKGTIDYIKRVIPLFAPEGKAGPELPEFPETPPIGFAIKTTPDGLRSHTVVPAEVLKAVGGFVAEIKKQAETQKAKAEIQKTKAEIEEAKAAAEATAPK